MSSWNEYNSKYIDGMCFVPVTFPFDKPDGVLVENLKIDDVINYINEKNILKIYIQNMYDFSFLYKCTNIEHLSIEFQLPFSEYSKCPQKGNSIVIEYDLDSVYSLKSLKSLSITENEEVFVKTEVSLDLRRLPTLQYLSTEYSFVTNLKELKDLYVLRLNGFIEENLYNLSSSSSLETVEIDFSKIKSLEGLFQFKSIKGLYLHYNRFLSDIKELHTVKKTLKTLRIENCPKIEDFSVLSELENLELLELSGSNTLPSLDFIKSMKNLKTFIFNMNVLDGDLTPCLDLSYVYSEKNRKHYNLKDKDLPKGLYVRGNEDIEEWRRLE